MCHRAGKSPNHSDSSSSITITRKVNKFDCYRLKGNRITSLICFREYQTDVQQFRSTEATAGQMFITSVSWFKCATHTKCHRVSAEVTHSSTPAIDISDVLINRYQRECKENQRRKKMGCFIVRKLHLQSS